MSGINFFYIVAACTPQRTVMRTSLLTLKEKEGRNPLLCSHCSGYLAKREP
jgi:hypothetical protein